MEYEIAIMCISNKTTLIEISWKNKQKLFEEIMGEELVFQAFIKIC